jgi:hypothetical protein
MKNIYVVSLVILALIIFTYMICTRTNFRFNRCLYNISIGKALLKESYQFNDGMTTPNLLFQTYKDKSKIPDEVYKTIQTYAPEYKHIVLDDNDANNFLIEYFVPSVLKTFNKLKLGAHKADLLRYCLLYIYGGVYMDISTELITPLSDIFPDKTILYTVLSNSKDHIYQAVICTPPNNPIFLSLIYYIVKSGNPLFYHDFCEYFLYQINKDLNYSVKLGLNISKQGNKYYILKEECSSVDSSLCDNKFDKYGFCCLIYDKGIKVIRNRRPSYPW